MKHLLLSLAVLAGGCSTQPEKEVIILNANRPPPFWPPHEHEIPAEKMDHRFHIHLQIIQAQQQDIWNHTGFEHDPTEEQHETTYIRHSRD